VDRVYNISGLVIKEMIGDFVTMPGIEIVHEVNLKIFFSYWPDKLCERPCADPQAVVLWG